MTEAVDPAQIRSTVCDTLLYHKLEDAKVFLKESYPFFGSPAQSRQNPELAKTRIFLRDGFIDRYTGKKLVYIGVLRLISCLMPDAFPYHTNWKMEFCHPAYYELTPTLDHIIPVSRGGLDQAENWVTATMLNNARKAHWTLEELGWTLRPPGDLAAWDGLITSFVRLVESDDSLRAQPAIYKYYRIAKTALASSG